MILRKTNIYFFENYSTQSLVLMAGPAQQKEIFVSENEAMTEQINAIRALGSKKSWPFTTGNSLVAFNTGLVGLISNSFFRRMLMVRKGLFLSSLPMAVLPGITMTLMYPAFVSTPIMMGDITCPLCASLRAGAIGLTFGTLYPFLLAVPLNSAMAVKYGTMDIPLLSAKTFKFDEVVDFWRRKMRYFKGQFISMAIFQTLLFAFVADRQFKLVHTELDIQFIRQPR